MKSKQEPTTALARRTSEALEPWRGAEWQRLWLSLQARPWATLAVIPASSGCPQEFSIKVATTLARTGMIHLAAPIHVADGTDLPLGKVVQFVDEVQRCRDAGDRILIALAPISENPVTEALIKSADCVLLCVMFELMAASEAQRTVEKIGKERFIGSTVFRAEDLA